MELQGRVVLITGASSGIGAATATAIARRGGQVLLLARTQPALETVAAEITAHGGIARVYPVDLTDLTMAAQVARLIQTEVGTPDILINNAGAGRWLFVEETAPAEAVQMMAVPYFAAFFMTHAFLPAMRQRRHGQIINVTSIASYTVWPGQPAILPPAGRYGVSRKPCAPTCTGVASRSPSSRQARSARRIGFIIPAPRNGSPAWPGGILP